MDIGREIAAFERFLTRERSSRFNDFQRGGEAPVPAHGSIKVWRPGRERGMNLILRSCEGELREGWKRERAEEH